MVGFFRRFVDTPEKLADFRRNYSIPDDVVLELAPEAGPVRMREVGDLEIPLVHIIEGGVRFPVDPLLRHFYSHLQLVPRRVATNVVRVIMSVVALNRITGSEMGLKEILHFYTVHKTPKGVYYFKKRAQKEELIEYLPDSERGDDDDYFIVMGNWQYARGDGGLYEIPRSSSAPTVRRSSVRPKSGFISMFFFF